MGESSSEKKDFLARITAVIEANLQNEQFGVSILANEVGTSRSNLHRKIKSETGKSVSQFIMQVRLKNAEKMLLNENLSISEIAYDSGFHSVSYFNKCFRDFYGHSPGEIKKIMLIKKSDDHKGSTISSKSKKIVVGFLMFVSLLVAILIAHEVFNLHIIAEPEQQEKSIAVLPFKNDSPDSTNAYFINGLMESILNNLSGIEDLSVRSRTSVEKYRAGSKSIMEIAEELGVNYIVEGSGQKYDDAILVNIQLLDADTDQHLFSEQYRKEIREVKDFIDLQSEIALNIVSKINAEISQEEKHLIEKVPTSSLTAYNFFRRGREEILKFHLNNRNTTALINAEKYYRNSLEYDSSYAQTYAGLAEVYKFKNRGSELFSDNFLDSMLFFADKAITLDKKSAEAYAVKGLYCWYQGNRAKALEEYNTALKYNPDLWDAYRGKGTLFLDNDPARSIQNFHKAASLVHGDNLKIIMDEMITAYLWAGFVEKALKYNKELLQLFGDSLLYFSNLGAIESQQGNAVKAAKYYEKAYAIDTNFTSFTWFYKDILRQLSVNYMFAGDYEKSLRYIKKWIAMLNEADEKSYNGMHRIAYVFQKTGNKEKATLFFDVQMEYCNKLIKTNHIWAQNYFAYYDRAAIHAFRGNKEEAYQDLRIFNQITHIPLWMVTLIKTDPLFDDLKEESEFQQIVSNVKTKYESEHKRIDKTLREMGYN